MTINFYTVEDDPRTVEKSLGNSIHSPDANIFGSCSVKNPVLILAYDSILLSANYFEIPDWHRFYFMGEPTLSPGGRCVVQGRVDVLMSNKDDILKLDAYCSRCESKFERYAVDSAPLSLVTTTVTNLQFSNHPFSAPGTLRQYLLTVKGGSL